MRFPDVNWDLADKDGKIGTWERVQIAVLMDIREELRRLNTLMNCHNVAEGFIALRRIDRRMQRNGMFLTKKKGRP